MSKKKIVVHVACHPLPVYRGLKAPVCLCANVRKRVYVQSLVSNIVYQAKGYFTRPFQRVNTAITVPLAHTQSQFSIVLHRCHSKPPFSIFTTQSTGENGPPICYKSAAGGELNSTE